MYVYKYSVDVYLLCMIKVRVRWYTVKNVTTFGKVLLLFCLPFLLLLSINCIIKTTRNELARFGMGTIFLVIIKRLEVRIFKNKIERRRGRQNNNRPINLPKVI